jgi:outer membrane protein assembly factor BamD (BamD/ComL family)
MAIANRGMAVCTWLGLVLGGLGQGCQQIDTYSLDMTRPWSKLPPPDTGVIQRAGHWEEETPLQPNTLKGDFSSARVLFDRGEYAEAEAWFHWLANKAEQEKKTDTHEDCLYWEAESMYKQKRFVRARETFAKLLKAYPTSRWRNEAVRREVEIAEYWSEDLRQKLQAEKTGDSQSWWASVPHVNFGSDKPLLGTDTQAQKAFEEAYFSDPTGPLAAHALHRAGSIAYVRERYDEADRFYSLLVEAHPRSQLAPHALELAVMSKMQVAGGPDYDGRKLIQARDLAHTAMEKFPELRNSEQFLENTIASVHLQQAEKEYRIAEFYRRTKNHGSAYFYFELVNRRYSGTKWAEAAAKRIEEMRAEQARGDE